MSTSDMSLTLSAVRRMPSEGERLLQRLRDAEPSAIGEVYDLHGDAIRAFARRLVGDEASAEDLVHDVFVAVPKAMRTYRRDASLRTFLFSIAINHARHHIRGATRRRAAMDRFSREPGRAGTDPERELTRAELASLLTRAMDDLPMDQRVAFVLCEVEGRTASEASAITGAPDATMRTRLFHAKRKLREALEREGVR